MRKFTLKKKNRYIILDKSSFRMAGRRGFNVAPQSRPVQLSGRKRQLIWKRPSGVVIQQDEVRKHHPIIDFTRILQFLFYGLSLVSVGLGFFNILGKRRGESFG